MLGVTQRTKAGSLTVLVTTLLILTSLAPLTAPSDRGIVDSSAQKAVDIAFKGLSSRLSDIGAWFGHGLQIAKELLQGILSIAANGCQPRQKVLTASTLSDNTWIADSASTASTAGSWQNGSLVAGQNIWFTSAHTGSCTSWDVANNFGSFNIMTGYTGTITQGVNFSVTSYNQAAGIFTGNTANLVTLYGSLTYSGGTISSGTTNYQLMTDGLIFKWTGANTFGSMQVSANATITTFTLANEIASNKNILIDSGKTLSIASGATLRFSTWPLGATFANNGVIAGSGTIAFDFYNANKALIMGTINAGVKFELESSATTSCTQMLAANTGFGSTLVVISNHASNTMTLDLSANNYSLSATSITMGTRGILNARASSITCSGSWDSSAGSFVQGTSFVHLTGVSNTLKRATGQEFYSLSTESGASYTMLSNITTYNYWGNGTLAKNGYALYINNDQAPAFTSSPSITSFSCGTDFYYNASGSDREAETLTFAMSTTLSGLGINSTTGHILRLRAPHTRGTFLLDVSLTEGNHTIWQNVTLTVINQDPHFTTTSPDNSTSECAQYDFVVMAVDPDNFTVSYSLVSNAIWLSLNGTTGLLSGISTRGSIGSYSVAVSAFDGNYTSWLNWTLVVGPYQGGAGSIIQASFRFSLDGNKLWYESTSYGNVSSVIWNFGDTSGSTSLSGTHEYTKAGTYQLTLIVYDADGKSSMAQTTLVVALSANAPVLRNAQGTGWNIYLWPGAILQISVLFLLIGGSLLIGMAKIFNGKKAHRIITKKGKVFIGTVMILLALYIIFFFSSPIPPLSFGW